MSLLSLIPKKLCGGTVFGIAKSGHPLFVPRECPLAAHHVGAEVGQLQRQGCEHGVAATAEVGGDGHGAAIEQGPKVIALHRRQAIALVNTGGIGPLYYGAQITQRGPAASWALLAAITSRSQVGVGDGVIELLKPRTSTMAAPDQQRNSSEPTWRPGSPR